MRELKANLTLARSLATNITKFNEKDKFDSVRLLFLPQIFLLTMLDQGEDFKSRVRF
jgi:hypothetical protein